MLEKIKAVALRLWFLGKSYIEKYGKTLLESFVQSEQRGFYGRLLVVLFGSFLLANTAIFFVVPMLLTPALKPMTSNKAYTERDLLNEYPRPNFRDIKKQVVDRNIFNAKGEFPTELDEATGAAKGNFDPNAPCVPTKLKISLLGTIFNSDGNSLATIKEDGFEMSDIYKIGDVIIGHEECKIHDITRNNVVINNSGVKECLEIFPEEKKYLEAVSSFKLNSSQSNKAVASTQEPSDINTSVSLAAGWIESELGSGFAKIITTARAIPNIIDGQIKGFKFFDILPGSLMAKIGIKDGDVILQMNNSVIEDNVFLLYQAFLDEREIKIRVLRGDSSGTITVQIK